MQPARVKAAKISCGENCAYATKHLHVRQRLCAYPRPARVAGQSPRSALQSALRAAQRAGTVHARRRDQLALRRDLDKECLEDRPYGSPARRGDAFSVPNDSSTVACVFQAARAILPGNPPGDTVRSRKCSSNCAASLAMTFPFRRGPLSWPCPAPRRIAS